MSIGGNFNNCPLNSDKSFRFFHLHAKLIYARVYVEQSSNRTGNLNLNNSHEDESDETTKVPAIYTKKRRRRPSTCIICRAGKVWSLIKSVLRSDRRVEDGGESFFVASARTPDVTRARAIATEFPFFVDNYKSFPFSRATWWLSRVRCQKCAPSPLVGSILRRMRNYPPDLTLRWHFQVE